MPLLEFTTSIALWQVILLSFISLLVGVLGGFVGLALGTMRLPAILLLARNMPATVAGGTNILVSTLSALTGGYSHLRERHMDPGVVLAMGLPSLVGAFIGGFFSDVVPESLLIGLVGAFVLWQGIEFVVRVRVQPITDSSSHTTMRTQVPFNVNRVATEAGIGFGVGLLGGAVGLILGSLRLPALVRILRIEPRIAAGTNLAIGFLVGSFGFAGHGIRGQVDIPLMAAMGSTGMVGTYFGAHLTRRVGVNTIIFTTGWVLIVVGALLLWNSYVRW